MICAKCLVGLPESWVVYDASCSALTENSERPNANDGKANTNASNHIVLTNAYGPRSLSYGIRAPYALTVHVDHSSVSGMERSFTVFFVRTAYCL